MASKREPYETRTVAGQRRASKLVKGGWEIVSTTSNFLAPSQIILRRPNPRYRGAKL